MDKWIAMEESYKRGYKDGLMGKNTNIPSMAYEVVEAVLEHYKGNDDTIIDCLNYLKAIGNLAMETRVRNEFENMGRCTECGAKFELSQYKEYHSEVNDYEIMNIPYCPNCDI